MPIRIELPTSPQDAVELLNSIKNFEWTVTAVVGLVLALVKCPIDFWNHLNNAAYLRFAELARVNWFVRTNIWSFLRKKYKYNLVWTAVTLRFRREISAFETIEIHTRVIYWDKYNCYVEQKFVNPKKDNFVHCILYGQYTLTFKGKRVTPEVLENTIRNRGLLMVPWNLEGDLSTSHIDTWKDGDNNELYECDLPLTKSLEGWIEFLTQSSAESKANLT
ncbi:hypothetical protein RFI_03415 [Reticulomyxa filosa]|uniref:Uncharacterized protein n=1 Tax=Reticulomyxa filosa TaxID=46433 RepID=X6P559_RETFI|nr:hypothetical protein RFI_03415 [Reticulomyxa filosa]|eukprot:ETO33685.1 hypothetical protein RFI_03415 [Reticulomyxa filosa]